MRLKVNNLRLILVGQFCHKMASDFLLENTNSPMNLIRITGLSPFQHSTIPFKRQLMQNSSVESRINLKIYLFCSTFYRIRDLNGEKSTFPNGFRERLLSHKNESFLVHLLPMAFNQKGPNYQLNSMPKKKELKIFKRVFAFF